MILTYILAFIAAMATDILWTLYILNVQKQKAFLSGLLSSLIYGSAAFIVINYVLDMYILIPAILGAFCGTYIIVKRDIAKNKANIYI